MEMTVSEAAAAAGISVRTLHYYDEIGLLRPSRITEAGYRIYDSAALTRLQEILFFRELSFSLSDIQTILARPDYDRKQAFIGQRSLLQAKRARLDGLIRLLDDTIAGGTEMGLDKFSNASADAARDRYQKEAEEKYGKTAAYKESAKRTARYGKADWEAIQAEADGIFRAFSLRMDGAPEDAADLVEQWQAHITKHYYPCTDAILAGLGELYTADARFAETMDKFGDGTAQFMSEAIRAYCAKKA